MRIVVLISGNGTNLQAIIDECHNKDGMQVVHVVSSSKNAYGLIRAQNASIPTAIHNKKSVGEGFDTKLAELVNSMNPDLIVLAGWMLILKKEFLDNIQAKIINLHPALPGEFNGTHAIQRAFEAKVQRSGVMVHYVIPEVDEGEVIEKQEVPMESTLELFEERIHQAERQVLIRAIHRLNKRSSLNNFH